MTLPRLLNLASASRDKEQRTALAQPLATQKERLGTLVAMSQENVEIVRRAFAAFERGNFWIPEIFDPSIRIVWLPVAGGEVETVGLDDMGRTVKDWLQPWEQATNVAERFIDAGDQVVVISEWRARGKASGVFTKWRYGAVWTLRDGKVISIVSYTDPAEALEAVGLSEQGARTDSS
jgi:ketosteroid isomerase-like protein